MSKTKNKNSLLAGQSTEPLPKPAADKIMAMKYSMDHPAIRIYPLNDKMSEKTYPDFTPCNEDDAKNDKLANFNYLNKGYFDSPSVSNEYFSARNLIQETVFSSSINCTNILKELSLNLTKAYKARNEVINKIYMSSNEFRLPPRVTLTSMKKEAWLKDLANPDVPLQSISNKLPHGIRNRVLFDNLCNLSVPIPRAIWFTKCILASEQLAIRKKFSAKQLSQSNSSANLPQLETVEVRWLQEWTSQVADYILKFAREMPSVSSSQKSIEYKSKLNYLLRLVQTMYIENLFDKSFFLNAIVNFLREDLPLTANDLPALLELSKAEKDEESNSLVKLFPGDPLNYGQILVALTLIKVFWNDVLESDYTCKSLSEAMLLCYMLIDKLQDLGADESADDRFRLPENISREILQLLSSSIKTIFGKNSNAFVLPNFWILTGGVLYDVLTDKKAESATEAYEQDFKLINFRNESLMLNMRYTVKNEALLPKLDLSSPLTKLQSESPPKVDPHLDAVAINRANDDLLNFVDQLDKFKLTNTLAAALSPASNLRFPGWKLSLKVLIYWSVSAYRDMGPTKEKILTISNFLKRKVLQPMNFRGSSQLKAEFENEILEIVFSLSEVPFKVICMQNLFVLINELIQLKIITIPSYFRKIIACGIFYISSGNGVPPSEFDGAEVEFHLALLSNLPAFNNKQYFHILKKWTNDFEVYSKSFERGIAISKLHMIEKLTGDLQESEFDQFLSEVKGLNVGVKYLIASWVTSQIKTTISRSPKLIHLAPGKIANIYEFYASTNNLSLFFKVFLRFVLKNENKVIIFYLDTLYFMSKLIVHHMTLVKSLAGNNVDSVSTAYELFKLIIINYKDLSSRETDIYDFEEIWWFMHRTIEKSLNIPANTTAKKSNVGKFIYNQDTVESPLKIYEHSTRSNVKYSIENFQSDLKMLLEREISSLSAQDVKDIYSELGGSGLDFSLEELLTSSGHPHTALNVLFGWYRRSQDTSEKEDIAFFKLLQNCYRNFQRPRQKLVRGLIQNFIRAMLPKDELASFTQFSRTILSTELISFADYFAILDELKNESNWAEVKNVVLDLLFEDPRQFSRMPSFKIHTFQLLQSRYKEKHCKDVLIRTFHLVRTNQGTYDREAITKYFPEVCKLISESLISSRRWTIDLMTENVSPELFSMIYKHLLGLLENDDDNLKSLASMMNEFSLPIFQIVVKNKFSSLGLEETPFSPDLFDMIDDLGFYFDEYNSYFGELFNYLDASAGCVIFDCLETHLLTQTKVHKSCPSDSSSAVALTSTHSGRNLIPMFKDYFKKFSVSCTENLQTTPKVFSLFSEFLEKILVLLRSKESPQVQDKDLHDVLSIFLRLLIIHKVTLTEVIASSDHELAFLKNLVLLLDSSYMSSAGNEKLKILLYDLLLLVKGSLTQIMSLVPAENPLSVDINASVNGDDKSSMADNAGFDNETKISKMVALLDLPELGAKNSTIQSKDSECVVTLTEQELQNCSDLSQISNERLVVSGRESEPRTFNGQYYSPTSKIERPFSIKSLELLQDTSEGLNNGFISLSLFDAYTTKENPY